MPSKYLYDKLFYFLKVFFFIFFIRLSLTSITIRVPYLYALSKIKISFCGSSLWEESELLDRLLLP